MSSVFLQLVNLSLTAGWLILAILVIRPLMKRAPRWAICALWALVGVRLICPVSISSMFSLVPKANPIPMDIGMAREPAIDTGVAVIDRMVNPLIAYSFTPDPLSSANPLQIWIPFLAWIWLLGMVVLLLHMGICYLRLKKSVGAAIPVQHHEGKVVGLRVLVSDEVSSPFILGIVNPLIYVPSALKDQTLELVLAHEETHIRRHDHWWKPLGFVLLAVYWFNPMCWIAYTLLCRDIELACDEKVIREMDKAGKAAYSQALLDCSLENRQLRITACPLAFGEIGVKERVKSVLSYKKPGIWTAAAALMICSAAALCFLTNPDEDNVQEDGLLNYKNAIDLLSETEEIYAIYYPEAKKGEDGKIHIGYVSGEEAADYLEQVTWQPWDPPAEGLSSPGSVELILEEDYRITVWKKPRWARVSYQGGVSYYKTHGGDYDMALELLYSREQSNGLSSNDFEWISYTENEDGTFSADNGVTYQYRLTLIGRDRGAVRDSGFVVLSNNPELTFERVSESMFTSNTERFLDQEEAVIVSLLTIHK